MGACECRYPVDIQLSLTGLPPAEFFWHLYWKSVVYVHVGLFLDSIHSFWFLYVWALPLSSSFSKSFWLLNVPYIAMWVSNQLLNFYKIKSLLRFLLGCIESIHQLWENFHPSNEPLNPWTWYIVPIFRYPSISQSSTLSFSVKEPENFH